VIIALIRRSSRLRKRASTSILG